MALCLQWGKGWSEGQPQARGRSPRPSPRPSPRTRGEGDAARIMPDRPVPDFLSRLDILLNPTVAGQVFVNGVSLSAIYILVALGFTLLFGIMRVVNFAHGEFAMLGAFAFYHLTKDLNWSWMIALPLGVIGV